MANTNNQKELDFLNEEVAITLFKDNDRYAEDVTMIVNGNTFVIPRGVETMVPRYVSMAFEDVRAQEESTAAASGSVSA